jgi:hypothetical protein
MNNTRLSEIKNIVETATLGGPANNGSLETSEKIHHADDGLPRSLHISYTPASDGNVVVVMNYAGDERKFVVNESEEDEIIERLAYSHMAELLGP